MQLIAMEMFDDQGIDAPLSADADGAEVTLSAYEIDGDMMTATVEGTMLRLTGYRSGAPMLAEGAEPIPVTASWQVRLPPLE